MTIFLTTQYLEEADVLADRVGIIDAGRLVAEGTPTDLKRSIGTDVIVARLDGDASTVLRGDRAGARRALGRGPRDRADRGHGRRVGHREPGGRRPERVRRDRPRPDVAHDRRSTTSSSSSPATDSNTTSPRGSDHDQSQLPTLRNQAAAVEPRAAGFLADTATIAGRALRAIPRDVETVIPPIFIALFFFLVNIGTLSDLTEGQIEGFDFTAFQLPTAILLGVTGVSRAPALVLDVQNGYFDRLLLTPVRRLAILLGHMVADVTVACALIIPIIIVGFIVGVRFETGPLGDPRLHPARARCGAWRSRGSDTRSRSRPATRRR